MQISLENINGIIKIEDYKYCPALSNDAESEEANNNEKKC